FTNNGTGLVEIIRRYLLSLFFRDPRNFHGKRIRAWNNKTKKYNIFKVDIHFLSPCDHKGKQQQSAINFSFFILLPMYSTT
ncbi:TPA: hypothetical protein ACMUUU_004265, partial [Salmonella enterica subsp. enterica]